MNADPARPEVPHVSVDPTSADYFQYFTTMGPTAFARERALMCKSALGINAGLLRSILFSLFGEDADAVSPEQMIAWADYMRERMQACDLLMFKHDLLNRSEHAWERMSKEQLEQLPPLPTDTIFGFERPRFLDVVNRATGEVVSRPVSIVVRYESQGMPFEDVLTDGTPFHGYTAYSRLIDQEQLYSNPNTRYLFEMRDAKNEPVDPAGALKQIAHMRQQTLMWPPTLIDELEAPLDEEGRTLGDFLRVALARAAEGRAEPIPREVQRKAKSAGVKRWYFPPVRTLELEVEDPPAPQRASGEPTERTINWEFKVGHTWDWAPDEHGELVWQPGHWRRYRDADGNVVKRVFIKQYTKGEGKPPKPKVETVTIARDPDATPGDSA